MGTIIIPSAFRELARKHRDSILFVVTYGVQFVERFNQCSADPDYLDLLFHKPKVVEDIVVQACLKANLRSLALPRKSRFSIRSSVRKSSHRHGDDQIRRSSSRQGE